MKRVFTDTVVRNMYDDYGHLGKDVLEMIMHTSKIVKVKEEDEFKTGFGSVMQSYKIVNAHYYMLEPPKNILEAYEDMGLNIPKEFIIRTGEDKVVCSLVCK